MDLSQFKNMSTGLKWIYSEKFGIQLRTTLQEGRLNGLSFKIEKSLFVKEQMALSVSYQTGHLIKSLNWSRLTWLVRLFFVIVVISTCRLAYRHVNGDYCGITRPNISPSNPFRNKLLWHE